MARNLHFLTLMTDHNILWPDTLPLKAKSFNPEIIMVSLSTALINIIVAQIIFLVAVVTIRLIQPSDVLAG